MRWLPGEENATGDFHLGAAPNRPCVTTKASCAEIRRSVRRGIESSNSLGVSRCGWKPILFTEDFDLGFGLLLCLVDILADLRNIIARRFEVDDEALPIGCPNNPPIRQSWIGEGEQKKGYQ
jgi:hypothetical protein